ncbi:MAG: U32 family peptidase [Bacilli bacterium]|nr:U32 family peptidase [Bacilli bacterium]
MSELLCPAGTKESFHAAISNGADAIYLGLDKFSARAYAENFTLDNLGELVEFAHLRNVKIYVTVNTITYDHELEEVYRTIDALAALHVDGIIVQDLAVLLYATTHYKSLQVSASTQCGIDDEDGVLLAKELGVERVVFARETPLDKLKEIKDETGIEVETFIHGALCVSYSGNCFMSSMIGERSGNRGRCAGCCRKPYSLIKFDTKESIKKGYLLSMKDLNLSEKVGEMSFVDSLKIEGRMKEPSYVSGVTRLYRRLLDGEKIDPEDFGKIFNRTYTKGFIGGETSLTVTNIDKPNNFGYLIGVVTRVFKGKAWLRLNKKLSRGDQIRIETKDIFKEVSLPITKMFDNSGKEIFESDRFAVIYCDKPIEVGAKVYKTKDLEFVNKTAEDNRLPEYRKLPLQMEFLAHIGETMSLKVSYGGFSASVNSQFKVEESLTSSINEENIKKQLSKLNETPYFLSDLAIDMDDGIFVPLKTINELRREAVEKLNLLRLERSIEPGIEFPLSPKKFFSQGIELTVEVNDEKQYLAAKECGIEHIYYKNVVRRNNATYEETDSEILVGGLGGIHHYGKKKYVVSDYSLNVVNAETVAILSTLGVERITLSQEMSKESIKKLIASYQSKYDTDPSLELIVYGRAKIMHSKYCPLKRLGHCEDCKKGKFALKDDFASFPLLFNDDCTTTLLNGRTLNLIDDLDDLYGVSAYRLTFTTEDGEETKRIIKAFQEKLSSGHSSLSFNKMEHTRGHFLKAPL